MEITQFTYFQQAGGIDLAPMSAEITYGLERLTMFLSRKRNRCIDIEWGPASTYGEIRQQDEYESLEVLLRGRPTSPTPASCFELLRGGGAPLPRGAARLPRLRLHAQLLALVQHARRPRRGLGDRAGGDDQAGPDLAVACAEAYVASREAAGLPMLERTEEGRKKKGSLAAREAAAAAAEAGSEEERGCE